MSGHNKWSQIKRQKGAADVKRGMAFTKLTKAVTLAAKQGGGDADTNFKLRLAIDKARAANMPKDNIARAIKRGTGELGGAQLEEITYEAYGPAGTAYLIETLTDNRNRTVQEVKGVLTKYGGRLGEAGTVAWMFETKGIIHAGAKGLSAEQAEETIIESGADDYNEMDGIYFIYTAPKELESVKNYISNQNFEIESAEITMEPKNSVQIDSKSAAEQVIRFVEKLEELDDVSQVYSNFDIDEDLLN